MTHSIPTKAKIDNCVQFCAVILALLSLNEPLSAGEQPDPSALTVERIFGSDEFEAEKFGLACWLEDGSGYTTLENSEAKAAGMDIIRYNLQTGRREIMVPATQLMPEGASEPLKIDDYSYRKAARTGRRRKTLDADVCINNTDSLYPEITPINIRR